MEPAYSSETSVTLRGLHDVISQSTRPRSPNRSAENGDCSVRRNVETTSAQAWLNPEAEIGPAH